MYGRIPHRLPVAPVQGDGEAEEAAERASGAGGSMDGFDANADEFRSDFASPDSEGGGGGGGVSSSSSASRESDIPTAAGSGDRDLTEEAGGSAGATAEATAGAEEERATAASTCLLLQTSRPRMAEQL